MTPTVPFLSVVVPAHNGERVLRETLSALLASDLSRPLWELVVVDDASTDRTAAVAAEYADLVVRLGGRARGPAYARNRGVEASRGDVVVFVDADVVVHADTLGRMARAFAADAGMAALFGSYDAEPRAPGLVSRFRNLLHHHVHQCGAGEAETFWAGCGAVRREVLLEVGMMDAWHFARPQIEDIELGRRLRRHGHRIVLAPEVQCTHLKRWTLRNMVVTDFKDRGTPWMRLLLREGAAGAPATLNLKRAEKACTGLVAFTSLALVAAVALGSIAAAALALAAVGGVAALNARFYRFLLRQCGVRFALASLPLHLIFYFTGGVAAIVGIVLHLQRRIPAPPRAALAEYQRQRRAWPPPADRPATGIWAAAR